MFTDAVEVLDGLYGDALRGRGSIIILHGESGVGKSHAVKSFLKKCKHREELVVLAAKGRPQVPNPLYLLYEGLADYLREVHLRSPSIRNLFKEYAVMLPRMAGLIRPLLQEDPFLRAIEATVKSHLLELSPHPHCLDFIKKLAQGKAVAFWLDDVQWADAETLGFLMYLCDRIANERMLWIICLNRRRRGILDRGLLETTIDYLRAKSHEATVVFHECLPWPEGHIEELIESILSRKIVAQKETLAYLQDKSRGIPYVLKVFLEVLRNNGKILEDEGGIKVVGSIDDLSLPDSLREAIEERLRGIYKAIPQARKVLELAAVIGERFNDSTIDAILELCDTYRLLSGIEDNYFLVRQLFSQEEWEFDHVTVRDFIYDHLGSKSPHLHRLVAKHLESIGSEDFSRISYHYLNAGDNEASLEYATKQAEKWLFQGFFAQARNVIEDLLRKPHTQAYLESTDRKSHLSYLHCLSYFYLSEYETCLQLIESMHAHNKHAALLRAKCLNKQNLEVSFLEALRTLQQLAEIATPKSEGTFLGLVKSEMVVSLAHLNRFEDAKAAFTEAERLLNPYEAPVERAQLMRRSCLFYEPELAEPVLMHAADLFDRHHVDHEVVKTLNNLATIYLDRGDLGRAEGLLSRAIKKSASIGSYGLDYLLNNMALVRLASGNAEQSLTGLREALGFAKRQVCRIIILNNQAAALLSLGEFRAAEELLARLLPEANMVQEEIYLSGIRLNRAFAFIRLGSPRKAMFELLQCRLKYLAPLGDYYKEQRMRLLLEILRQVGSLRNDSLFPSRQIESPIPHVIDMQFWGD